MILDINNIGLQNSRANQSKSGSVSSEAKTATAAQPKAPDDADKVQLSQEAQTVSRLQAKIADSSGVDLDKVAAIKQAIAEGKFEFNPERIAENMLNQEDLLS